MRWIFKKTPEPIEMIRPLCENCEYEPEWKEKIPQWSMDNEYQVSGKCKKDWPYEVIVFRFIGPSKRPLYSTRWIEKECLMTWCVGFKRRES